MNGSVSLANRSAIRLETIPTIAGIMKTLRHSEALCMSILLNRGTSITPMFAKNLIDE